MSLIRLYIYYCKLISKGIDKLYFVSLIIWISPLLLEAQTSSVILSDVDLQNMLKPFWETDTIYNEIVQPIKEKGKLPEGRLLFEAKDIIAVKDTYLKTEYKKSRDWMYKRGKIFLPKDSEIPYFTREELIFNKKKEGISMDSSLPGKYILFSEDGLLQSKQLAVTYLKKRKSNWNGEVPEFAGKQLSSTFEKLQKGKSIKIVFYGNSIETGANSSSLLNQSPYLPTWPELVVFNLRQHYEGPILFSNKSKGGMRTSWGAANAENLINPETPDLVIIGFGMNDGSARINPQTFKNQIQGIVNTVKEGNPQCEFIIITTMIANPYAIQSGIQKEYRKPILELQREGIAIADLTGIHEELLRHKSYQDMTGNNVNHPNDYLARWYAQVISALLIKY